MTGDIVYYRRQNCKIVEYKMKEVMSGNRKSNGKYSLWLNIEPEAENENSVCIDWNHVGQWSEQHQVTAEVSDEEHAFLFTSE